MLVSSSPLAHIRGSMQAPGWSAPRCTPTRIPAIVGIMTPEEATVCDNGVRYFAARNIVLGVRSPLARVKLLRIAFGTDGSIYVSFPYMKEKRGLVSRLTNPSSSTRGFTYSLTEQGVSVPVDLKFAHHASGRVHFSRDGFKARLPRGDSFALASGAGEIFQLHIQWLHGFAWLDEPKSKDLYVGFTFSQQHPFALRVVAEWVPKAIVSANAVGASGDPPGPRVEAIHKATGKPRYLIFLGQPAGSPLAEHVLALNVEPVPIPEGADTPGMIFLARPPGGELAFIYPYTGPDCDNLGISDIPSPASA